MRAPVPPTRTPLAHADAAWLRMDEPTNPMVVTGVMVFDTPLPAARLRRLVETRLLRFPRFTARLAEAPGGAGVPSWETDPGFSLRHHVFTAQLPAGADDDALRALVGELIERPLDHARPLWEFHLVPRFQGGAALIGRFHHAMADGLALVHVMLAMADGDAASPPPPAEGDDPDTAFWESMAGAVGHAAAAALQVPIRVLREVGTLLERPERIPAVTARAAAGLGSLGRLALLPPDPPTRLRGPLGRTKRVAWSPALDLEDFRRVGRVTGATVNDVLLAALTGALRRVLLEHDAVEAGVEVRGVVPVDLRRGSSAAELGNHFGLAFVGLPVGLADPLDRVFDVRRRTAAAKDGAEAEVTFQVLRALGAAPRPVFDRVVDLFGAKATVVVTNVAGPRDPVTMAGARMRRCMFWVPSAGRLAVGVSLLSYAGRVFVGVQSDAGVVPDPGRIVDGFLAEIALLLALERDAGDASVRDS